MNVNYSHSLDDSRLIDTLGFLSEREFVVGTDQCKDRCWSLTPQGGKQWELERRPNWDLFIAECVKPLPDGRGHITVLSPNENTVRRFWDVTSRAEMWEMDSSRPRYWRIRRHKLLSWRDFPEIHVFAQRGQYSENTDWNVYEANRTWWRTIAELAQLRIL